MGAARAALYGLAALVAGTVPNTNTEGAFGWQGPAFIALLWAMETVTRLSEEEQWAATVDYLHQQMERLRKGLPPETKEEG